jgi:hypothetical protein
MAVLIEKPVQVAAAGNKSKIIREYVGRAGTKTSQASVARMSSPDGPCEHVAVCVPDFSPDTVRRDPA